MSRKILISFLGISNYDPVGYYIDRKTNPMPPEKYIQKTILNHLAKEFGPDDSAYIFLTEEARKQNWEDDGHTNFKTGEVIKNRGLARQVEEEAYHFAVHPIDVNGESEPEAIWDTFERLYDCMQPEDEVYLDITHSWRYLPMLATTLLNYAKVLKNIQVKAIYYGAFEQLGTSFEVRRRPIDDRPVPVLNLVSFSELQDWTVAADDFVQDGNPGRLIKFTRSNLSTILRDSKGQDEAARNMNSIARALNKLVPLFATNRGREIWEFDFQPLQNALQSFTSSQRYVKPLNGVIDHIRRKVEGFNREGNFQWLEAVRWCIEHRLVQQGITQLQEGLISWLCEYYEQKKWAEAGYFDKYQNGKGRALISKAVQFVAYPPPEEEWFGEPAQRKDLCYKIMADPLAEQLTKPFSRLSKVRNDINHGGYTKTEKAKKFEQVLKESYEKIEAALRPYSHTEQAETGLLNLSNHPAERWTRAQVETANKQYGHITDLPFPNVDPGFSAHELEHLVDKYYKKVLAMAPRAVHLMGEMTFTHALVQKLKEAGIPCVASTSERQVTETAKGEKVVRFRFVQFREY